VADHRDRHRAEVAGRRQRLADALSVLAAEDSCFGVSTDQESGQVIIRGMGELQLDGKINIIKTIHQLEINVGSPQVAFREKLTAPVTVDYTLKRQQRATGAFARVKILAEPLPDESGFVFENRTADGSVPIGFIPGVERGFASVMSSGVVAGFPVVDLKATLLDGAYHDVDSSVQAFEIASRAALREALQKGGSVLLEPVMAVTVAAPDEAIGGVIADLHRRRGQVQDQVRRGNTTSIHAMVPLMNMFGYPIALRAMSQAATFTMRFDHYAAAQPNGDPSDGDPPFRPAIGMRA
jgi:elongation factor G